MLHQAHVDMKGGFRAFAASGVDVCYAGPFGPSLGSAQLAFSALRRRQIQASLRLSSASTRRILDCIHDKDGQQNCCRSALGNLALPKGPTTWGMSAETLRAGIGR